jgi:copper chaperone CopZ
VSATETYAVTGMTCDHCEMSVQEGIGELEAVVSPAADHTTGPVTSHQGGPLDRAAVAAAVEEAG